jgi:large subunit ribosomal protein L30
LRGPFAKTALRGATIAAAMARVGPVVRAVLVVVAVIAATTAAAPAARIEEADVAEAKNKTLKITWVKSAIGYPKNQKATITALGLHRLNQTVEQPDNPAVRGQIFKVQHLVRVEE